MTEDAVHAPVRVLWFDERVEITSPGGPYYGVVTKDTFDRLDKTNYRYPALAAAMKTLGYVNRFGRGITLVRIALEHNGNPGRVPGGGHLLVGYREARPMATAIALFNNKAGVGKTTLTYHLAHMVSRLGWRVLAVDLDPEANRTSALFDDDKLELFWEPESSNTVLSAVAPLIRQLGDVQVPEPFEAAERLWVVPGDLGLSSFEDRVSDAWPRSFLGDEGAIRVTTAFHRMIRDAPPM